MQTIQCVAISDTHDHTEDYILEHIASLHPAYLIHCGDVGSQDTLNTYASLVPPNHFFAVGGDHDGHLTVCDEPLQRQRIVTLGGLRFGLIHGDRPPQHPLWGSLQWLSTQYNLNIGRGYDYRWLWLDKFVYSCFREPVFGIFHGHTHVPKLGQIKDTLIFGLGSVTRNRRSHHLQCPVITHFVVSGFQVSCTHLWLEPHSAPQPIPVNRYGPIPGWHHSPSYIDSKAGHSGMLSFPILQEQ